MFSVNIDNFSGSIAIPQKLKTPVAKFLVPDAGGDLVDSGIGLSYRSVNLQAIESCICSLHCIERKMRYILRALYARVDYIPQSWTKNMASGLNCKLHGMSWKSDQAIKKMDINISAKIPIRKINVTWNVLLKQIVLL